MRDILTKNEKGLFYAWKIVLFCMSEIMLGNSVSLERTLYLSKRGQIY